MKSILMVDDNERNLETAKTVLGNRGVPLYTDDRLKEINFGISEGIHFDEAKQDPTHPLHNFFRKPESYSPLEGAESFAQVAERGRRFLQEKILPLEADHEAVLIVAHGAFNRSFLNPIMGVPMEDFWRIELPNCAVSILSLEKGQLKVLEVSKVYYGIPVNSRP